MSLKQAPRKRTRPLAGRSKGTTGGLLRRYVRALGPGVVTGASDNDPSGIATYAQAGARFGLGLLWTSVATFPLMAAVQEICDRTALATGRTLGELAEERLAKRWRVVVGVLLVALIGANTVNITADLLAVGNGMTLLHAGPPWLWALVAGIVLTVLISVGSFSLVAKVFKVLCFALLAYVGEVFIIHVRWRTVALRTILPSLHLDAAYVALLLAVLGTTISPYLFFWQSAHRLEALREAPEGGDRPLSLKHRTSRNARKEEVNARMDVVTGMAFSCLVMWAVIMVTAQTVAPHHQVRIRSAAQAAAALKPVAGSFASLLFALGFIGAGMLAVPILAGAGAAGMAGLLRKDWGFSRSIREAPVFYGLVGAGTAGGTILSLFRFDPIKLLVFSALVNGIAAAPFLVLVMVISGNQKIMGKYRNGVVATVLGWLTVALMASAAVALFLVGSGP